MQEASILEVDQVEKNFKKEKGVRAVWRLLPKLILITLMACLILFLAGLVYCLVQYYLTGEILYFLPEANQVISFVRSSTGLLAIGTVLAITLFVFALSVVFEKKNKKLNDEQANEAEASRMFQAMIEIEEDGERPEHFVPLPIRKKAFKKIYGKCREHKETKNEEKIRNKLNNKRNSGQRGNIVIFNQKSPSLQKRADRPKAAPEPRGPL